MAFILIISQEGSGKSSTKPETVVMGNSDFLKVKPVEPVIENSSGQCFGALTQHYRRSAAEDQKSARGINTIHQNSENRKQFGQPLNFVDDH